MKHFLTCIHVFVILVVTSSRRSFAFPTTTPTDLNNNSTTDSSEFTTPSASTDLPSSATSKKPENNPLTITPEKSSNANVVPQKEGNTKPLKGLHEDVKAVKPIQNSYDVPQNHQFRLPLLGAYPANFDDNIDIMPMSTYHFVPINVGDGDMATAESNIVFRPLFTYRSRTAEKRRVYYQPASYQRGTYATSRTSRSGYPDYYNNAPYDYVP